MIILTWLEESEIIEFGDYIVHYTFDASPDHLKGDIDYAGEKTMCALLVAVELLNQTEGYVNYDKFYEGMSMISNIIKKARLHVAERALRLRMLIKMILLFILWAAEQDMVRHIWKVSASSWKCNGWIPAAFIQANTSMVLLRLLMQTVRL